MGNGIEVERVAGGIDVLTLRGEHDLSTATDVSRRIESALESASGLAIDLSETTFIDSAVLKELLRARAEFADRGVRLVLAAVPVPVRRLMDLTRTSELFAHAESAETALTQLNG